MKTIIDNSVQNNRRDLWQTPKGFERYTALQGAFVIGSAITIGGGSAA